MPRRNGRTITTAENYDPAQRQWRAWCTQNGIDPIAPAPDDIGLYLLERHDNGLSWSTLSKDRAAIRAVLLDAGHTLPVTLDRVVTKVLGQIAAAQRHRPSIGKLPLDMRAANAMLRACDADPTALGRRDKALLALSWALCANSRRIAQMTLDDLAFFPGKPEAMSARFGDTVYMLTDRVPWCPVAWTRAWLVAAKIAPGMGSDGGPLFRPIGRGEVIKPRALRGADAPRIIKRRAEKAGLDPAAVSGMSLRFGRIDAEFLAERRFDQVVQLADLTAEQVARRHMAALTG